MQQLYELRDLLVRHCEEGRSATVIPRVSTGRSSKPTEPTQAVHEPAVCFIVQGAKQVLMGENVFRYDAASYLIASLDVPVSGHISEASEEQPYLGFALHLDPASIAAILLEMPSCPMDPRLCPSIAVNPITPDLLEPALRLMRLLDRPDDIRMIAPLAEREILYRLLQGPQAGMLRQIAVSDSRLSQIRRATAWIRSNYEKPLRIEAVARIANMSPSSFHRHFRAVTAMSPLQFQKRIRLQEARKYLLAGEMDATRAGFAVGYDSPSQFSREYSRLYGNPPSRDAVRMREFINSDGSVTDQPL